MIKCLNKKINYCRLVFLNALYLSRHLFIPSNYNHG